MLNLEKQYLTVRLSKTSTIFSFPFQNFWPIKSRNLRLTTLLPILYREVNIGLEAEFPYSSGGRGGSLSHHPESALGLSAVWGLWDGPASQGPTLLSAVVLLAQHGVES